MATWRRFALSVYFILFKQLEGSQAVTTNSTEHLARFVVRDARYRLASPLVVVANEMLHCRSVATVPVGPR